VNKETSVFHEHKGHEVEKVEYQGVLYWVCHTCEKTIGKACEVYSRIVGYLRPVNNWNSAKQEEFKQRKTYHV
jgi:anaerobic ribonucleoside-triphosphate reductase